MHDGPVTPADLSAGDLAALNSLTKYPSITTYHPLEKGRVTAFPAGADPFPGRPC